MTKHKKYDWNQLYEEYRESGLKKVAFAKEKGISDSIVYKNFRLFENCENHPEKPASENLFVQVDVPQNPAPIKQSKLTLEFEKFTVSVDESTNLDFLTKTLKAVMACFE